MNINENDIQIKQTPRFFNAALIIGALSLLASVIGAFCCGKEQFFFSALTAAMLVVGVSLGAMIFVFIHHVVGAQWSVAVRRVAEIIMSVIPYTGIMLAILVLVGAHELFIWSRADVVATDHLIQKKVAYLNMTFFTIRLCFYVIVWIPTFTLLSEYILEA
jgi:hypothetical protein